MKTTEDLYHSCKKHNNSCTEKGGGQQSTIKVGKSIIKIRWDRASVNLTNKQPSCSKGRNISCFAIETIRTAIYRNSCHWHRNNLGDSIVYTETQRQLKDSGLLSCLLLSNFLLLFFFSFFFILSLSSVSSALPLMCLVITAELI